MKFITCMNSLLMVPIDLDDDEVLSFHQRFLSDKSIGYLVCSYPLNPHPDLGIVPIHNGLAFRLEAPNQFNDALIYFGVLHFCLEGIRELHGLNPSDALENVHFFSTQLFTKLKINITLQPQERYKCVYNWAHPTPIFKKKFLLFIVNVSNVHWYSICFIRPSLAFKSLDGEISDKFGNLPCILVMDSISKKKGLTKKMLNC